MKCRHADNKVRMFCDAFVMWLFKIGQGFEVYTDHVFGVTCQLSRSSADLFIYFFSDKPVSSLDNRLLYG